MSADPEAWRNYAECRDLSHINFFPTLGETTAPAKAVCDMCSVKAECLEFALANEEMFGIWGGTSERQRRLMRRDIRRAAGVARGLQVGYVPTKSAKCGTTSGYMKHRREGSVPCQECRNARNAYNRSKRQVIDDGEVA